MKAPLTQNISANTQQQAPDQLLDERVWEDYLKIIDKSSKLEKQISARLVYICKIFGEVFDNIVCKYSVKKITPAKISVHISFQRNLYSWKNRMEMEKQLNNFILLAFGESGTIYWRTIKLHIPVKWLYEEFETDFVSKAKMIKTFQ